MGFSKLPQKSRILQRHCKVAEPKRRWNLEMAVLHTKYGYKVVNGDANSTFEPLNPERLHNL
jgi:hypothetical protein